jgi:hypothetical protein
MDAVAPFHARLTQLAGEGAELLEHTGSALVATKILRLQFEGCWRGVGGDARFGEGGRCGHGGVVADNPVVPTPDRAAALVGDAAGGEEVDAEVIGSGVDAAGIDHPQARVRHRQSIGQYPGDGGRIVGARVERDKRVEGSGNRMGHRSAFLVFGDTGCQTRIEASEWQSVCAQTGRQGNLFCQVCVVGYKTTQFYY